jgi:hypothetical protein
MKIYCVCAVRDLRLGSEESSESDSVEEDDDGELAKYVAGDFLTILPMISGQHPNIYEPKQKFFPGSACFPPHLISGNWSLINVNNVSQMRLMMRWNPRSSQRSAAISLVSKTKECVLCVAGA